MASDTAAVAAAAAAAEAAEAAAAAAESAAAESTAAEESAAAEAVAAEAAVAAAALEEGEAPPEGMDVDDGNVSRASTQSDDHALLHGTTEEEQVDVDAAGLDGDAPAAEELGEEALPDITLPDSPSAAAITDEIICLPPSSTPIGGEIFGSTASHAANSKESGSEEGYEGRAAEDAGSRSSHAGSHEGSDSGSEEGRTGRRRGNSSGGGGGGGGSGAAGGRGGSRGGRGGYADRRDRDRSREEWRPNSGGSSSSLSPRWDRGTGGGAAGGSTGAGGSGSGDAKLETSPRRRGAGGGDGSPRELVEPSKVLHVRNVGYPVLQADLVSLLSCFGMVEKIKMFSGQALVQLPSVSVAKATMRHYGEDEEAKIGGRKVYINYSRSRSIEGRDGDNLSVGNFNSNSSTTSNGVGGGGGVGVGGGGMGVGGLNNSGVGGGGGGGLDLSRAVNTARGGGGGGSGGAGGGGGPDGNGKPLQDAGSPYAHLIMEDHAKLLGLATRYLQTYGIPAGEGAVLNVNRREEMTDYQRQTMGASMGLHPAGNGHGHGHGHPMGGWNGNAPPPAMGGGADPGRHIRGMSGGGGFAGYSPRPRSGSRGRGGDWSDRFPTREGRGVGRGGAVPR